ncbi:MAG TPA: PIN domain-containing protein [Thermoanaerobaculia bacterium]|nr:PIN domain-containing protein [Thermoanaerobaculia bacterium]
MTEPLAGAVFLDTSYAIALVNHDDNLHAAAILLADRLRQSRTRLLTTRSILLEIGDGLSGPSYRAVAASLLDSLQDDPGVEIVDLTPALYDAALTLYRNRPDKGWGLTDCFSFVVMSAHEVTAALTHDIHFQQAGFRALLR